MERDDVPDAEERRATQRRRSRPRTASGSTSDPTAQAARADRTHGAEGVIPDSALDRAVPQRRRSSSSSCSSSPTRRARGRAGGDDRGVAIVLTSTLLLLWFLDNPYHKGVGGLEPVAMERTLSLMDEQASSSAPALTFPCDENGCADLSLAAKAPRPRTGSRSCRRCCSRWRPSPPRGRLPGVALAGAPGDSPETAPPPRASRRTAWQASPTGRSRPTSPTFIQWVDAYAQDDKELATFYYRRFRPSSIPPSTRGSPRGRSKNPKAPLTPSPCRSTRRPRCGGRRARGKGGSAAAEARATWIAPAVRALRRALRHGALLRRDQHALARVEHASSCSGSAGRVPRHRRLDRDVPGHRRALNLIRGASASAAASRRAPP